MQNVLGYSQLQAGSAYLPATAGVALSSGIASQLFSRLGTRSIIVTRAAISAGAIYWLSRIPVRARQHLHLGRRRARTRDLLRRRHLTDEPSPRARRRAAERAHGRLPPRPRRLQHLPDRRRRDRASGDQHPRRTGRRPALEAVPAAETI
jgi:hypothetical protein